MLTVTSKVQINAMRKQKNALEFEQMMITNQQQMYAASLDSIQIKTGLSDSELKDNAEYMKLVAASDACEERGDLIATEIELLEEDMAAFEQYHQNGVQQDTTYWCFGGG